MNKIPVDDEIVYTISRLVEDSNSRREPSHYAIGQLLAKVGLSHVDPNKSGASSVGKTKRVQAVLSIAIEELPDAAELFAAGLLSLVRGSGGFRQSSPNFVGKEVITNLISSLKRHGIVLSEDGNVSPSLLDNLTGQKLTDALNLYIRRAKRGHEDAALLIGTSKDLIEAVCAHVVTEIYGSYSSKDNFPTLIGTAFAALKLTTPADPIVHGEPTNKGLERSLFELACSVNRLRNKQGTGHGRPFLPTVSEEEAKLSIESIGIVSEYLMSKLANHLNK